MATKKKLLEAAAGNAGGEALNVEDVFSTYLYEGTGTVRSIDNGIDLDGEGGLVWIKKRDSGYNHMLFDTERGPNKWIRSDTINGEEVGYTDLLDSFNSNGFTLDTDQSLGGVNYQAAGENQYASWTFRKAPKFFDVVTYTGTGAAQSISHNLGSVPGAIIVKRTDTTSDWSVYHTSLGATKRLRLNSTATPQTANTYWNYDSPTSTEFTVGTHSSINASGGTYVAYLFAHNDGDGEFGPTGDQDIIKCGSYTGNASLNTVTLGFEPQIVIIKPYTHTGNWEMYDTMRGFARYGDKTLYPNLSNAESAAYPGDYLAPTPTGFELNQNWSANTSGYGYIYIAIRRGPMGIPESASEVFAMDYGGNGSPAFISNFIADAALVRNPTAASWNYLGARLQGSKTLRTNSTDAESAEDYSWDYMNGAGNTWNSNYLSWMWRRAPSFFDVVAYTGDGVAGRTVSHNLGVAPDMVWFKKRSAARSWYVHVDPLGITNGLVLNATNAEGNISALTAKSATDLTLTSSTNVNDTSTTYIAYLFASLDGVSKVGSYTGNGTSQTIDCGFTSGARFVLIKSTAGTHWLVYDTERGIVSGSGDKELYLDDVDPEYTRDTIDPNSSGFSVNGATVAINGSGYTYIFYAIA